MHHLISITIPAYKLSFLREAIESCLNQTYSNFELIIVDDASPEDLLSVVQEFNDERIHYYRNEKNCGAIDVVVNWNKCLEYATGDYIICMGDDDKLLPNCLEDYTRLINKYPGLGVYHTWTQLINEDGNFIDLQTPRPEFESVYSLIWNRWKGRKQYIGDFLFDTKLLKANGGFYKLPLAWGSDDISAVIAAKHKGVANTQQIGFCYRINSQTISKTGNIEIKLDAISKEKEFYDIFLSEKPNEDLDRKILNCIINLETIYFDKKKGLTIANDLRNHTIFRIIHWIRRRKKYKFTKRILLYAIIQSLK